MSYDKLIWQISLHAAEVEDLGVNERHGGFIKE